MWNLLKKYIKNNNRKVLLGRWGNNGKDIKNIYANHDHCGDTICKDPKIVQNIIKDNKNILLSKINKI